MGRRKGRSKRRRKRRRKKRKKRGRAPAQRRPIFKDSPNPNYDAPPTTYNHPTQPTRPTLPTLSIKTAH